MTERARSFLKPEFKDGERPSGEDFSDLIDSCVNKQTDGVSIDADGNMVLRRGVRLGDSNGTVDGGLRFNNNQLQVFTGGTWVNVGAGGGGGFGSRLPTIPESPVFRDSLVGIGAFAAAAPPKFRLEVPLGANNGPGNRVRFGNVVCANGIEANAGAAVFSHVDHADLPNSNYALRQTVNGATHVNAAAGQRVSVRQGGTTVRLGVSVAGNVIVGGESDLAGAASAILQVAGGAFKNDGSGTWANGSDARVKEDVRDLELGLAELRQVRPIRYRYNGRAGTQAGRAGIGVLGQEIEVVFPETIRRVRIADDPGLDDMRVFDPSALTYVLINAVKELAAKVDRLEQALALAEGRSDRVTGQPTREAELAP
jgi:hypothetical protein